MLSASAPVSQPTPSKTPVAVMLRATAPGPTTPEMLPLHPRARSEVAWAMSNVNAFPRRGTSTRSAEPARIAPSGPPHVACHCTRPATKRVLVTSSASVELSGSGEEPW